VQYWKLTGEANHYWPIGKGFVLYLDGKIGDGETYGKNGIDDAAYQQLQQVVTDHTLVDMRQQFPFFQNFFSGGVTDVRGFQDNTLGPRICIAPGAVPTSSGLCPDGSHAEPIGGAFKVLGTAELYLPLPFLKDVDTARVSWFVDTGNAYTNIQSFNASTLRASTGLSLHWQAPIGPLIISFALPFRTQPSDGYYEERIQFTFGSTF